MSGVCAIWAFDPLGDDAALQVRAGLNAMVHRGGDGFSIYFDRNVGLGHCLLDTGCNGMFVDEDGFAISFDGRIDNREELLESLEQQGVAIPPDVGRLHDKVLLLLLFRTFGDALPDMLRGDFAIVFWNPLDASLFLCRDHLGVRPLFWHRSQNALYLASEIKALCAMAGGEQIPVREDAATAFLSGEADATLAQTTIYQGVFRLLPGHFARMDDEGLLVQRYWRLLPGLPVRRPDSANRMRTLLRQAINRRLRSDRRIGTLLSGGLDSSAIVSLIGAGEVRRRLDDIAVFSLVFARDQDESAYISAVEAAYGFAATRVDGSNISAFDDCDTIVSEQDQPIPAPNISTFRHFLRTVAQDHDVRVVLDGHGGDEVVSYGDGIFQELAENGRWLRLWRELAHCDDLPRSRPRTFAAMIRTRGLLAWRRAARRILGLGRQSDDPVRYTSDGRARPFEQAFHMSKLTAPMFATALEAIDHNAAAAGIEIRMPFLDVDLLTFCVTVPTEEKWACGTSRAVLRDALRDVLPPAISARRDKFDFTDRIRSSVLSRHRELVHQALYDVDDKLVHYADLQKLRANWDAFRENGTLDGKRFHELWRSVMLHRWLRLRDDPSVAREAEVLSSVPAE